MNSCRFFQYLILVGALQLTACTKSEHPMVAKLEKSIAAAEANIESIELALKKTPEQNQGLTIKLQQDKQLAVSRLERLKENLFAIAPEKKLEPKAPEEGGHGGGH